MPITPFHFGPAALLKAATPVSFSFVAFALTQVIIDLEPMFYMTQGAWPIHRFFHTYLGASIVALATALLGKPLCEWGIALWNARLGAAQRAWMSIEPTIPLRAAVIGALFGGYSHVLLDSIMHSDMQPFAPFAKGNALLYLISIEQLHLLCTALGALGVAALLGLLIRRRLQLRRSDGSL